MVSNELMISTYEKHKNLKLAADELGISFQTLYWRLKKMGVNVTGDKERYGSEKDKLAAKYERFFQDKVPTAKWNNNEKYQAKIDFDINGIKIDVKAAKRNKSSSLFKSERWMFSIRKQIMDVDFFVMFALDGNGELEKCFLIPGGLIASMKTVSISCCGKSKWHGYEVDVNSLAEIFASMH